MGKLSFFHGPMGSGKSEELLKIYRNYTRVDIQPFVYSFADDNRFTDETRVVSRNGDSIESTAFDQNTDFGKMFIIPSVIMVDEGQFLADSQVRELATLVDEFGVEVLVFGLRTDAFLNFFEGSETLFKLADKLIELKTLCAFCTKKAIVNGRFVNGKQVFSGAQVQIGDEDYKGMCRKHYMDNMNR